MDRVTPSWPISTFASVTSRTPTRRHVESWRYFAARPVVAPDKADVGLWSPATFEGTRKQANVVSVSALVLDYDGGATIERASELWADYAHVLHTSYSHAPGRDKFRVILPYTPALWAVSPDLAANAWRWANQRAAGTIDRACSDLSRMWYLPSAPDLAHFCARVNAPSSTVRYLDPRTLPDIPKRTPKPPNLRGARPRSGADALRLADAALARDPEARRRAADRLGAELHERPSGPWAKVACPGCGRVSLAWAIEPHRMYRARCDHRESCGYSIRLIDLLRGRT